MGNFERLLELADLAGKKNDPAVRMMLRRLALKPDQRLASTLERYLTVQAGDESFDPAPFRVPSQDDLSIPEYGHIPQVAFGSVIRRGPEGIERQHDFSLPLIAGHSAFIGTNRAGKTMGVRQFLASLPEQTKCLVIDSENDPPYVDLALSRRADEFQVIDWKDLKIGLLSPPAGVDQSIWLSQAKRNFRESLFLRDGSISLLTALFEHCLKEQPEQPLSLRRVHQKLVELRYRLIQGGREYSFYESIKNRLESLLTNPVFDCAVGFDIADLASKNTLLRFRGIGNDEFALIVNDILLRLGCHFRPEYHVVPRLVVVLEEVHRMTNPMRLRRADIAEPVVLDSVRTLAKCRVSLLFVDQVPSQLPAQILANTNFRAIFNTIEGRDLEALQRSLSLEWEQRKAISQLPKQVCLVQYANPKFPQPFLVKVHDVAIGNHSEEELAERRARTLEGLSFLPVPAKPEPVAAKPGAIPLLSKPVIDYLIEISKNQLLAVSKRDRELGVPLAQGSALRGELVAAGLVSIEQVNTFGRQRKIRNTRITDKGYELLRSLKIECTRPSGKGSWQHVWHQHAIAAWGRANGFEAQIECVRDGKAVDVSLEKDGRYAAVEILNKGVHKELNNLRDLVGGFSEIWLCAGEEEELRMVRQLLTLKFGEEARAVLSRIKFRLLNEFQL